ncbi:hypothetical protein [Marinibactrum halimedae]|uniref:Mechanosensitive ion channel family protein n=1 Tax=Marinibactrum halimedae TaxID=1444977 RepID=A0AA37T4Y8_9GAMM|nr:hypothetical protein [Marinibactrum halimedae]MCD9458804.1 hypothetical protein [Marinibactrum halimedae]GLS25363.1 hypothetical protein GCM10007877_10770 [Marinibactrum halimedae]
MQSTVQFTPSQHPRCSRKEFIFLRIFIFILTLSAIDTVYGKEEPLPKERRSTGQQEEKSQKESDNGSNPTTAETLAQIQEQIKNQKKQQQTLKRRLAATTEPGQISRLESELRNSQDIAADLHDEFIAIATGGAKLFVKHIPGRAEYNWQEDLEAIIAPFLDELKEITARPRILEDLQSELSFWKKRRKSLSAAIEHLESTLEDVQQNTLRKEVVGLLESAQSRHTSAQQKITLIHSEIKRLEAAQNPIWETISTTAKNIARSMGIHLIVAILAAALIYQLISLLGRLPILILGKQRPEQFISFERSINLIKRMVGATLGTLVYLMVLYGFSEWLILVLSLIIIASILMSLRVAIPQYLVELRTLLNMGSVRQGERLMYQGIPWRVKELDVYTHLHNPWLDGHLRVPVTELSALSSRPFHQNEPWFPCRLNDVLLFPNGVLGIVEQLSPEQVQIERGKAIFTYQIEDLLKTPFQNLTRKGFSIFMTLPLDYTLQPTILESALPALKTSMLSMLRTSEFAESLLDFTFEFDAANDSSLDFRLIASFTGKYALQYYHIKRRLEANFIEACNSNGWTIPFHQLMVHQPPSTEGKALMNES